MLSFNLSACGDLAKLLGGDKDEELPTNDKFTEPVSECEGAALPQQFMVRWTNGQVTVVHAENRREFFDKVLLKYEKYIDVAEYNFVVKLDDPEADPPPAEEGEEEEDPFLNWGPAMVHAQAVWDQGQFGQNMIVAVVDSGADKTIDQLQGQFFVNPGEIADNGEDDDGNGFVDDVSGWDFHGDSNQVEDLVGHGSHVSGIIAARHDLGEVKGLAPGVALLPLNFMDETGSGTLGDAVTAIDYAVAMGAKIINASWGGAPCSEILKERIQSLSASGVLFIAAAGNNGADLDTFPEFPAAFDLPAQITVGSSTINDFMSGFSNHSRSLVALVAPGSNIISTVPEGDSPTKSGTSMATPFVSAAAALIWSAVPSATSAQVKQALLESVDEGPFVVETEGRLNVEAALNRLRELVP